MKNEIMTPYTVIGSNGTCPNTFMVSLIGGQYADVFGINLMCYRNEGEADAAFWDRAVADVGSLMRPLTGYPKQHVVIVTCLYESISFSPAPSYPEAIFKAKGKKK